MTNPLTDASIALRQTFRDQGVQATALQLARMIVRCGRHIFQPAERVRGLARVLETDYAIRPVLGQANGASVTLRVAVACHIFYPELAPVLRAAIANIPSRVDLFLTTDTTEKSELIRRHFARWDKGSVAIMLTPNRGRDIAPKLTAFDEAHANYDIVLHLHSKRSHETIDGAGWRDYLFHNLIGSPAIAASILAIFASDPSVGMIAPQHWPSLRYYADWGWNFATARAIARRMGLTLTPAHAVDFPSGSMFWTRPAALRPLLDLGFSADDFPDEGGQIDGTMAHAIERLLFVSCELAGFRWLKVCDPPPEPGWPPTVTLNSVHDLADFHRQHGFRLTSARVTLA